MKKMFTALCLLFSLNAFSQTIYYVNDNASGAGNGTSWANAFTKLQDALAAAVSGDQVWVAVGIYFPDEGAGFTNNNRTHSFHLKNGVAIYGGFVGTETNLSGRNWNTHVTTLSGDIDQDNTLTNNAIHVIQSLFVDNTAILDGFIITGGNADIFPNSFGGGMYNDKSSPTLINCNFSKNNADWKGGGTFNNQNSSPILTNCSFTENTAGVGGAMANFDNASPTLTNCSFSKNKADYGGGIINNQNSSPILTNCSFTENTAGVGGAMANFDNVSPTLTNCSFSENKADVGGGIWISNGSPTLSSATFNNCNFSKNTAEYQGGAIQNNGSSPTFTNCIFSGNTAYQGGGIFNGYYFSSPTLMNCSFTENTAYDGGGFYSDFSSFSSSSPSSPILTNCRFLGNTANSNGGGIWFSSDSLTLTNCSFSENKASGGGGGIFNSGYSTILTNCSFSRNLAINLGGGMYNELYSPILVNCSFAENEAGNGGGIYTESSTRPTLTNCILWGNTNGQISSFYGESGPVAYSIVQGGFAGTGNLDKDPMFVDAANGDLHLQAGSPAINKGLTSANTTSVDLDGKPRVVNGIIDMGAYEFQVTAAPVVITSVTANPSTLWPPNHKMKEVKVTTVTTGGSGNTQCSITKVTSNEPQDGNDKDDVSSDWQIIGNDKVLLRAERNGKGNGRIYTLTVSCTDAGSSASRTVQVKVPHDQGKVKAEITQSEFNEAFNEAGALNITASPNPSSHTFNLTISGDAQESILLRVINTQGKVVEQRQNIKSGQSLQIGEDYAVGLYLIEIQQGSERKTIKVVKQ